MRQLRIALRRLWREPAFSLRLGILTLGIAAPTALFAVVQATLLRPLPYAEPGRNLTVRTTMTDGRFTIGLVASAEMNALRRTTDAVVQSTLIRRETSRWQPRRRPPNRRLRRFAGLLRTLRRPNDSGRPFNEDDLKSWTGSRVVLSHHAWLSFFGGDPGVVGRTIRLAEGPGSLVVGIAPETFAIPPDADL